MLSCAARTSPPTQVSSLTRSRVDKRLTQCCLNVGSVFNSGQYQNIIGSITLACGLNVGLTLAYDADPALGQCFISARIVGSWRGSETVEVLSSSSKTKWLINIHDHSEITKYGTGLL